MSTLYAEAVNNWPEDEATLSVEFALDLFETEGADSYHQWLIKERQHWIKVFNDPALMGRFSDKFNALTFNTTNLAI
jgi:hypothetical protein